MATFFNNGINDHLSNNIDEQTSSIALNSNETDNSSTVNVSSDNSAENKQFRYVYKVFN